MRARRRGDQVQLSESWKVDVGHGERGVGHPQRPEDLLGTELAERLTGDHLDDTAQHVGGSKVAVEYASFYRATGTPTTIVSRGPLLATGGPGRMDDDLRRFVVGGMRARDVRLLEHSTVSRIVGADTVEAVEVTTPDGPRRIEADFVLIATGEKPNVESFVDALPVARNADGFVTVNSRMQTSIPNVYAAGGSAIRTGPAAPAEPSHRG